MQKKTAIIFAGAEVEETVNLDGDPVIIAADSGLDSCLALEIEPDFAIGDFDSSLKFHQFDKDKCLVYPKDKDKSDLELAIDKALSLKAEKILVHGGLGGLSRHFLANLILALKHPLKLFFTSKNEWVFAFDKAIALNTEPGQLISLLPMFSSPKLTTSGLKWEISEKRMDQEFISLSNECQSKKTTLIIEGGSLLCCLEKKNPNFIFQDQENQLFIL